MGIQSSLYSGISGLATNGNAMTVIGNNIANTNTVGFKTSRVVFSDLLSSTVSGSGGESQVGRGVGLSTVDDIFSQGTFESTESNTDLAVEGTGFFMLKEPSGGSEILYSRAGAFRFNETGQLINAEGYTVQGYFLDENGNPAGDISDLKVVTATSGYSTANPTTEVALSTNLNSKSEYNTYNATTGTVTTTALTGFAGLPTAKTDMADLLSVEGTLLSVVWSDAVYQQNSAKDIVTAVNAAGLGVTATATANSFDCGNIAITGTGPITLAAGDFKINGVDITGTVNKATAAADLEALIDAKSTTTGVSATVSGNDLTLAAASGANIVLESDGIQANGESLITNFQLLNGTVAEVSTAQCVAQGAGLGGGEYFQINSPLGGEFLVWLDLDNGSTAPTPASGQTLIEVDIATGDTAIQVATAVATAINANAYFGAVNGGTDTVTITNANVGSVTDTADGAGAASTGFTLATTVDGVSVARQNTNFAKFTLSREGELVIAGGPFSTATHGFTLANYAAGTLGEDSTFDVTDPINTSNYATSIRIFDSFGDTHLLTNYFRKMDPISNPLQWEVFTLVDGADLKSGTAGVAQQVGTATLSFDSSGSLTSATKLTTDNNALDWVNDATQTQEVIFTMNTTQYASQSVVNSQSQDGYAAGTLVSVDIDTSGYIYGKFSNGDPRVLAQLALASFNNTNGLTKKGNNLYAATSSSGPPVIGTVGSGVGKLFTNSLEQSNVDLAQEFVKMITIQRGFQANSKIITTTDEMMNDLINLKR